MVVYRKLWWWFGCFAVAGKRTGCRQRRQICGQGQHPNPWEGPICRPRNHLIAIAKVQYSQGCELILDHLPKKQ